MITLYRRLKKSFYLFVFKSRVCFKNKRLRTDVMSPLEAMEIISVKPKIPKYSNPG